MKPPPNDSDARMKGQRETGAGRTSHNVEIFQCLDHPDSRRDAFGVSLIVHAVIVTVLVIIPLFFTDSLKLSYNVVTLAPPMPKIEPLIATTWTPAPKPKELRLALQPVVSPPIVVE